MLSSEKRNESNYTMVYYILVSLTMTYAIYNYFHVYVWTMGFQPVEFLVKPLIVFPAVLLLMILFVKWTSYAFSRMKDFYITTKQWASHIYFHDAKEENEWKIYSAISTTIMSMVLTYAVFNLLNIHVWAIAFNPIDYILKPFLIFPAAVLLLTLFMQWTSNALNDIKEILIIKRGKFIFFPSLAKSLPIQIIDHSFLEEYDPSGNVLVDMRMKDMEALPFDDNVDIVKLYNDDHHVDVPSLVERANRLIKETALRNKPITFIVDSKRDRSRTISKIWLRLIRNPNAKSAKEDIHTISQLVY
ncbi:hypothetical protein LGQ02_01115 [Bacillus shivajii]|uniref:hypothetical protein n=1 Tax=Bacillus shivajii TaxID=1983719 RepID=UPI001CFB4EEF|nr:hypothetical protein [Bacillus shivajii]UCZ53431.1 hypothetical protein LGQ02_01115 [Bacillus shivajii]